MKKHRLFYLFASLTQAERVQFGEYVSTPYFNKHQKIIDLVSFLNRNIEKYSPEIYDKLKHKAFEKIFAGKEYNSVKMSRLQGKVL